MPGVDLFLYNPLAQSFLQATDDFDIGTPDGYSDAWDVQTIDIALAASEVRTNVDHFFFSTDFLVYASWQQVTVGAGAFNARWIDVDGRPLANTRMKGILFTGLCAQYPKPFLHAWLIPQGKFISIDIENEDTGAATQVQLNLVGCRRTRVG